MFRFRHIAVAFAAALVALAVAVAGFGAVAIASADRGYYGSDWHCGSSCHTPPPMGTVVDWNVDGNGGVMVINPWGQPVFAPVPPPPPSVRFQARFDGDGWFVNWVILSPRSCYRC